MTVFNNSINEAGREVIDYTSTGPDWSIGLMPHAGDTIIGGNHRGVMTSAVYNHGSLLQINVQTSYSGDGGGS